MLDTTCKITKPNIYSTRLYGFDARYIQNLILSSFLSNYTSTMGNRKRRKEEVVATTKQDKTNTISTFENVSNIKYRKCVNKDVKS